MGLVSDRCLTEYNSLVNECPSTEWWNRCGVGDEEETVTLQELLGDGILCLRIELLLRSRGGGVGTVPAYPEEEDVSQLPPAQILQVRIPMQLRARPSSRFPAQETEVHAQNDGGVSWFLNVPSLQEKPTPSPLIRFSPNHYMTSLYSLLLIPNLNLTLWTVSFLFYYIPALPNNTFKFLPNLLFSSSPSRIGFSVSDLRFIKLHSPFLSEQRKSYPGQIRQEFKEKGSTSLAFLQRGLLLES